jgi:hypothetical protein
MTPTGAVLATRPEQGELLEVPAMTKAQALRITEQIRHGIEGVWSKMYEAYEKRAHVALGYERWEDYVREEFKMSRGESYRLVNQGKVINSLASAGGVARAREAAPYVSMRQAEVLKNDIDVAAVEIISDIKSGMDTDEAVRAAVDRRRESHVPALPRAQPATIARRVAQADPEALMVAAADLRERLRAGLGAVKGHVSRAPRREADDPETLRHELEGWLVVISQIVHPDTLDSLYMLRAEIYDWLKTLGVERKAIAQLAGVSDAAVDYSVAQLRAVAQSGKRKPRA